jgi:hypothetical protein
VAFRWTLLRVLQSGVSLELTVLFTDDASSFRQEHSVHIDDASTASAQSVVAAIVAVGTPLKQALLAAETISLFVGTDNATNVVI